MNKRYAGSMLIFVFLCACSLREEVRLFRKDGLYGFTTGSGKIIQPPQFQITSAQPWNGIYDVRKNNLWGMMDTKGKMLTEIKYDFLGYEENGLISAGYKGKRGFLDNKGNVIIDFEYDQLLFYSKNYGIAKKSGKCGLINKKGETIIPFDYNEIIPWKADSNFIVASINGKWGFINIKNEVVIPFEYSQISHDSFKEGLAAVQQNKKWGFIDTENNIVIPFEYGTAAAFSNGLAQVSKDELNYGYIDHKNNMVIPFIYENPYGCGENGAFDHNRCIVKKNGKYGFIDKTNTEIIPIKYDCIHSFHNGFAFGYIGNGKTIYEGTFKIVSYGYIDSSGKEQMIPYPNFVFPKVNPAPSILPDSSHLLKSYDTLQKKPWTLEKILACCVLGFKSEPVTYPDLDHLNQICIAYGLGIGHGNYSGSFVYPDLYGYSVFKEKTMFCIISDESLRIAAWNWAAPYYKEAFQSMHPLTKKAYREIAVYIKNYINNYNRKKTESFLRKREADFAYFHPDGYRDPNRKLSAFVDRLILKHKVITEKDAKIWINKIADEMLNW